MGKKANSPSFLDGVRFFSFASVFAVRYGRAHTIIYPRLARLNAEEPGLIIGYLPNTTY